MKTHEIISEVDSLPIDKKTELIDHLLKSINPISEEVDELWRLEVEKRVDEIRSGKVKTIPAEKVFKELFDKEV